MVVALAEVSALISLDGMGWALGSHSVGLLLDFFFSLIYPLLMKYIYIYAYYKLQLTLDLIIFL